MSERKLVKGLKWREASARLLMVSLLFFGAGFGLRLAAQNQPVFFAQLDQTRLVVGARAILTVSIEGEDIDVGSGVELPSLSPYFQIEGQIGPSIRTEMSIINGRMTKRTSWQMQYVLIAVKPGIFTIPRMALRSRGKIYYSNPIQVEILEAKTAPAPASTEELKGWAPPSDPYLKLELDRSEYYPGEQIRAAWYLYFQKPLFELSLGKMPVLADFNVQELESVSQLSPMNKVFRGEDWKVAFIKSQALFALRAGNATIGSLELNYQRATGRRDFFGMPMVAEYQVSSEPVSLTIKPLPPGAPPDFTGAVGKFSVFSQISRSEIRVGESINLEVEIKGDGNPDYILEPKFEFPSAFEVYPPEVKLEKEVSAGKLVSHKKFNYVIVARQEGEFQIPEIGFRYFDPQSSQYLLAKSEPIKIRVNPGSVPALPGGVSSVKSASARMEIKKDIRYLKPDQKELPDQSAGIFGKGWFWLMHLLGFLLLGLAFWFRAYQVRLESDQGFARKQRAFKQFKKQVKNAFHLAKLGNEAEFSSVLKRALLEYFGNKFNQSPWGLLEEEMQEIMMRERIPESAIQEFLNLLKELSQTQYAGKAEFSPEQILSRAEKLVQTIEKSSR